MTETERVDRGRAVLAALGNAPVPTHVLWRLAALVGADGIVYAEAALQEGGRGEVSGEAVVYTTSRVVHAVFGPSSTRDEPDRGASTVDCRTWSRSRLLSVATESGDGKEDWAWHHDWTAVVPGDCQITLRYDGGTTLALPLRPTVRPSVALDELLPGLLADIERP